MNIHRIHQIWRLTTTNSSKLELISSLPNEEAISVMEQYFVGLQINLQRDGIKLLEITGITGNWNKCIEVEGDSIETIPI